MTANTVKTNLNQWASLPDIEQVDGRLSSEDKAFLEDIGRYLAKSNLEDRFCVTLLHSHFKADSNEALLEQIDEKRGLIVTTVRQSQLVKQPEYCAKSWMFSGNIEGGLQGLRVLTWINKRDLPQEPLSDRDGLHIEKLFELYRNHKKTDRFGMAFIGRLPKTGKVWTEGTDHEERKLIQEQFDEEIVKERDPILTMYRFDKTGKLFITLGCCVQAPSNRGHTGSRHPWGIEL